MDVENANCKAKVSQCADMEILPIEKPLKVDVEIKGLQTLLEELHRVFSRDYVNVQEVQTLMCAYKSNPKDWSKFAKFDRFRYTRNLVDSGNGAFNVMIICWGPGHASSIHDHSDSHCFMKLLSGNLDEVRYEWPENVQPEVMKVLENNNTSKRKCCSNTQDDITNELSELNVKCETDSCQNGNTKKRKCLSDICQNGDNKNGKCQSKTCQNGDGVNGKCQSDICQNGDNKSGKCQSKVCQNGDGDNGNCQSDNCQNCDENNKVCDSDDEGLDFHDMKVRGRTRMKINDVCYINDALGLHRVENPSHVDGAVSLHLYCPPFDSCRVFDARTGKPAKVKVTFWSMYGKKIKRVMEANS